MLIPYTGHHTQFTVHNSLFPVHSTVCVPNIAVLCRVAGTVKCIEVFGEALCEVCMNCCVNCDLFCEL